MTRRPEIRWDIYKAVVATLRHLSQEREDLGTVDHPIKRKVVLAWIQEHAGVPVQDWAAPGHPRKIWRPCWRVIIPVDLVNLKDRTMRKAIHRAVATGAWPTVVSSGGGLYLARDAEEITRAADYLDSYLKAHAARLAGLRKAAERAALEAYAHGEPGQGALFPERRTS